MKPETVAYIEKRIDHEKGTIKVIQEHINAAKYDTVKDAGKTIIAYAESFVKFLEEIKTMEDTA